MTTFSLARSAYSRKYSGRDGVAYRAGAAYAEPGALCQIRLDGRLDRAGRVRQSRVAPGQMVQEQRAGEDRRGRVGLAGTGDVRGGTVDRLEHRRERPGRVDVPGGGQADAAGHGCGQV